MLGVPHPLLLSSLESLTCHKPHYQQLFSTVSDFLKRVCNADMAGKSKKREVRDAKFGFGGRKKLQKQNSAESSADMNALSRDSRRSVGGRSSGGLSLIHISEPTRPY